MLERFSMIDDFFGRSGLPLNARARALFEEHGRSIHAGTDRLFARATANAVEIRVSDTGTGIPEAIRTRVYDPFFTTKGVGKGTGQGLAIAHDVIVVKHGGTIDFDSEPGVGTTFIVTLPLDCTQFGQEEAA